MQLRPLRRALAPRAQCRMSVESLRLLEDSACRRRRRERGAATNPQTAHGKGSGPDGDFADVSLFEPSLATSSCGSALARSSEYLVGRMGHLNHTKNFPKAWCLLSHACARTANYTAGSLYAAHADHSAPGISDTVRMQRRRHSVEFHDGSIVCLSRCGGRLLNERRLVLTCRGQEEMCGW